MARRGWWSIRTAAPSRKELNHGKRNLPSKVDASGSARADRRHDRRWCVNFFASCTQTSTGLFVVTLKECPPTILNAYVDIHTAAGTALSGEVRGWVTATKKITIAIMDDEGAVADPASTDFIRLTVIGRESTV